MKTYKLTTPLELPSLLVANLTRRFDKFESQWQTFSEFLHQKLYEVFDFKAKSGIGEFKNT